LAAFGLAACAGSSGTRGYLYRYGNGEAFIQLQRHGRHLHGTIRDTQFAAVGPARLLTGGGAVRGTISGSNVTLRGLGGTVIGTLSSFGLVIRADARTGAPLGERYRPASVADYNAAVAQTEATVQRQKARQAAEEATTPAGP
jgi:hypothetical protein